ncbi:DMT family transporter [Hylemonella sp. W303a]|uniref:DMT family transporter n=1 Tax=Hylemonella sp. W303a TaxID=3389873 RepID=UPI00396B35DD
MRLTHRKAVWLMLAVTLMWSIAGLVSRQLTHAHGLEVTFWRSFFTVLTLLAILPLWQGRGVFRHIPWRDTSLWLSGVCWGIMFTAFMFALTLTTVANVLVTMALGPLFTALMARFALRHKLPVRTWVAIVVAGAGIVWMYGAQLNFGKAAEGGSDGLLIGSLIALIVPIAGSVQWTVAQHQSRRVATDKTAAEIGLVPSVLIGAILSSLVTLPLTLPWQADVTDLGWLGLLGVVQLGIPCVLAVFCARVLKAAELALLGLLEVIFGILWAWLGAGEAPGANALTGGLLVIGALAANEALGWAQQNKDKRNDSPPPSILS